MRILLVGSMVVSLFGPAGGADAVAPCRPVTPAEPRYDGSCDQAVDRFAWQVLADWEPHTVAAARRLGPVLSERSRTIPNHSGNGNVEVKTLVFDGLLIEGAIVGEKVLPSRIEVESARWRVHGGLGVGATASDIFRRLGNANRTIGDTLEHRGMTETVRFTIEKGKVKKLVVTYYTG